jgi:hypothetical protein
MRWTGMGTDFPCHGLREPWAGLVLQLVGPAMGRSGNRLGWTWAGFTLARLAMGWAVYGLSWP